MSCDLHRYRPACVLKLNCLQTLARFRVHVLTCLIWWSLVLGTRMGEEGTCRRRENAFSRRITQDTSCMCTAQPTMLGRLTTVVLFLRQRSTSLWNTWELSLQWQSQTNLRSNSWVWSNTGTRKRASQWKDGRSIAKKKKMYGWWTMVENLKPFIMGALLDLLRCPSLWTSDDGISRSSSIFSWGITPELFMVSSCLRQDAKTGLGVRVTSSPFFPQHFASSARHVLKRDEWSGAEREQRANYC